MVWKQLKWGQRKKWGQQVTSKKKQERKKLRAGGCWLCTSGSRRHNLEHPAIVLGCVQGCMLAFVSRCVGVFVCFCLFVFKGQNEKYFTVKFTNWLNERVRVRNLCQMANAHWRARDGENFAHVDEVNTCSHFFLPSRTGVRPKMEILNRLQSNSLCPGLDWMTRTSNQRSPAGRQCAINEPTITTLNMIYYCTSTSRKSVGYSHRDMGPPHHREWYFRRLSRALPCSSRSYPTACFPGEQGSRYKPPIATSSSTTSTQTWCTRTWRETTCWLLPS
jgi:hypothetical protein